MKSARSSRASAPARPSPPPLEWLNYHHLFYFYVVAREGTIARACEMLRLAQPTISGQLKQLEDAFGEPLFDRSGRRLVLTEVGRTVYRHADEIFAIGRRLQDTLRGRSEAAAAPLRVGIADTVPKAMAHRLLEPALRMSPPVPLVCTEDKTARLLAELALRDLDLVLSDAPLAAGATIRAFNHALGDCGVAFLGTRARVAALPRAAFPRNLDGAPMLLPSPGTEVRRAIDAYFERNGVRPRIVAEFEDSALMKVFGERGEGIFPVPTAVAEEVAIRHEVELVDATEEVRERFYAITIERRLAHPATRRLVEEARRRV